MNEKAKENGASNQTRTDDLIITNDLLYQLSYAGTGDNLPVRLPTVKIA